MDLYREICNLKQDIVELKVEILNIKTELSKLVMSHTTFRPITPLTVPTYELIPFYYNPEFKYVVT